MSSIKTNTKGFTLIELVVAMAVYSLLLVLIGYSVTAFTSINEKIVKQNKHDDIAYIEGKIRQIWSEYNGEITLDDGGLFKVGKENVRNVYFDIEKGFIFGESVLMHNTFIISINRQIAENEKHIIFEIEYLSHEKTRIKRIVLNNLGGNKIL